MGAMTKKSESMSEHAFSQYELTTNIITKLNTFKLTPTAKLVLLYLTTCYNPKHKEVFPKQKTIADKLGVSERSVTRAVQELFKEGLVLIECKYTNRYKFTSKIASEPSDLSSEKMSDDIGQNDTLKRDNLSHVIHEQKKETKKEQRGKYSRDNFSNSIEIEGFNILKDYAQKNCTSTPERYLNWILKREDVQKKILSEHRAKENTKKRALRSIEETQSLIKYYESMKNDVCTAESCGYSLQEILKKRNNIIQM